MSEQLISEARLLELLKAFQLLSVNWSANKIIYIRDGLAMPVEFGAEYLELLGLVGKLGMTEKGDPNYDLFDLVKLHVPRVRFFPGEQDSFGWVTGVCQVNNLRIVF